MGNRLPLFTSTTPICAVPTGLISPHKGDVCLKQIKGIVYSAMLWALGVGVQVCASVGYPNQIPEGGTDFPDSPLIYVTQ